MMYYVGEHAQLHDWFGVLLLLLRWGHRARVAMRWFTIHPDDSDAIYRDRNVESWEFSDSWNLIRCVRPRTNCIGWTTRWLPPPLRMAYQTHARHTKQQTHTPRKRRDRDRECTSTPHRNATETACAGAPRCGYTGELNVMLADARGNVRYGWCGTSMVVAGQWSQCVGFQFCSALFELLMQSFAEN